MIDTKELRQTIRRHAQVTLSIPIKPKALTELLDRLDSAEKERANANAVAVNIALEAERLQVEIDALRAKIAEMEQQKPVGKFTQHPSNGLWEQEGYGDNPEARPLYALPGAKGEEK